MVVNQMTRRGYCYRRQKSLNTHERLYMIPSESSTILR